MEIIQNKELYHICTAPNWKVGYSRFFGNVYNYFFSHFNINPYGYKTQDQKIFYMRNFIQHVIDVLKGSKEKHAEIAKTFNYDPLNTLEFLQGAFKDYFMLVRELIYEEVRLKHFPNCPSRMRCIWVIPKDKKALTYWNNIKKGRIFILRLTGKILRTNERYLIKDTYNLKLYRELAFLYWAGIKGESKKDEILFEGYVKVIKEISLNDIE